MHSPGMGFAWAVAVAPVGGEPDCQPLVCRASTPTWYALDNKRTPITLYTTLYTASVISKRELYHYITSRV